MKRVLNDLIEFGKDILKDTEYVNDERWINGAKKFYDDNYAEIADEIGENDAKHSERISQIMLAQFKHIDSTEFRVFFSHYILRNELTSFENKLFQISIEQEASVNISELEEELDEIIEKFSSDFIEQEQEWINQKISSINKTFKRINTHS